MGLKAGIDGLYKKQILKAFAGNGGYGVPAYALNLLNPTLDTSLTFSRASSATMYNSAGTIVYAPMNLLVQSNIFTSASWNKTNVATPTNGISDPFGGTAAWTVTNASGLQFSRLNQHYNSMVVGAQYTVSSYFKAGTANAALVYDNGGTGFVGYVKYTLSGAGSYSTSGAVSSATITSVGSGLYLCSATFVATSSVYFNLAVWDGSADQGGSYPGSNNGTYFYAYGAWLEATSYDSPHVYNSTTSTAYQGARFDYNPSTLALNGLLIEQQSTNLNAYSGSFAHWGSVGSPSPTTNNIAPDGTATAYSWAIGSGTTGYYASSVTVSPSTTYTISSFVKSFSGTPLIQVGSDTAVFGGGSNTYTAYSFFNPATQTFSSSSAGVISTGYEALPNGWYRAWVVATTNSSASNIANIVYCATAGNPVVGGWGGQVEAGTFPTSYIPTIASTVTRAVDSLTNTNPSFFNSTQGTMFGEFILEGIPTGDTAIAGASTHPTLALGATYIKGSYPGIVDAVNYSITLATNTVYKAGFSFISGAYAVTVNGNAPATGTNAQAVSAPSILNFGVEAVYLNGWLRNFSYYPTALTNAQLQTISGQL